MTLPLVLASGSPRRSELLSRAGHLFRVVRPDVPEIAAPGEAPEAFARRLSVQKAAAVASAEGIPSIVVAADTIVVLGDPVGGERILGKPADDAEAGVMLRSLVGREHEVITAFTVRATNGASITQAVRTRVRFGAPPEAWLDRYVATGEGRDKAGAYAIQGQGAFLVRRISGSHSNVIGLPLAEVLDAIVELGGPEPFASPAAGTHPSGARPTGTNPTGTTGEPASVTPGANSPR